MSSPSAPSAPASTTDADSRLPRTLRVLGVVERVGNALPHPFWLFWILAGILGVASAVMSALGVSVISPADDKKVVVENLLSGDGLAMAMSTAIDNFTSFGPMGTIVVVIMGVAVAEHTGFLSGLMRVSVSRVPSWLVVFAVAFAGTMSHVASAAAYAILVPLGGVAFRAVGRSPILGIVVAYTSIASGYDASPIPTPNDTIFAGITTAAARIIDPDAYVSPLSNWFFNIASSLLLAVVITLVTNTLLAKRPDLEADEDAEVDEASLEISARERRAMLWAILSLVVVAVLVTIAVVPGSSPLRGEDGTLDDSPFLNGVAVLVGFAFALAGIVFGVLAGTVTSAADVPALMARGVKQIAPVLVLFFSIAQFLAYFDWTHIGDVVAVGSAQVLKTTGVPLPLVFLMVLALLSVVNVLVTSGSAMWSIAAPVLVPMLMLVDVPAETTQALFRIADSGSTAITPMSPYFVLALGFLQQYRKKAGIGTLAAFTLPLAVCMTLSWTLLFFAWWLLGIPLGPGAPVR
ncbi:AbgT family transporter [Brachybacterium kimchii]|uniref:AbgT family transporter n=1 Tax=Brachybacterium kimchii TaxID=2942909 RepID=A0ABY4N6T6_9MICO|nr:AbgT family transporter [Brachybacterium kimchii]UQN29059.1 AbgT family transporter [Brachybacterium kimchii]